MSPFFPRRDSNQWHIGVLSSIKTYHAHTRAMRKATLVEVTCFDPHILTNSVNSPRKRQYTGLPTVPKLIPAHCEEGPSTHGWQTQLRDRGKGGQNIFLIFLFKKQTDLLPTLLPPRLPPSNCKNLAYLILNHELNFIHTDQNYFHSNTKFPK